MRRLVVTGAVAVAAGMEVAWAVTPSRVGSDGGTPNIAVCHVIKDGPSRLKCFDSIPMANVTQEGASSPIETAGGDKVIVKWNGSTEMTTRPFHVDGPWELQWNTAEGFFSATLHRTSGQGGKLALLANGTKAGSSSSYQPTGGDFYIEFGAMQPWSARVVAVPPTAGAETAPVGQEPLLDVTGDQSGLPACDDSGAAESLKHLVEHPPMGQTMHISVLHVGTITSRRIRDGMSICTAPLTTNGGELSFDYQYYRKDGEIYIFGKPRAD